jgi:hypothetical protein
MLDQQVPDDTDMLAAFLGTAIGDHVEKAVESRFTTEVLTQAEIEVTLRGEQRNYQVKGHPDMILTEEGIVLDGKTAYGLTLARRIGADQQKQFQRHAYGMGAFEAGLFGDRPFEEIMVGNVWVDRAGKTKEVHVQLEPLSTDVLDAAGAWLDEVVYAFINKQEAMKEPAREVCRATCGFYSVCRAWQTDVEGLLTDNGILEAIKMYDEGMVLARTGERLKKEAKPVLEGISGYTEKMSLRWVRVNETETRQAYDKIELKGRE